MSTPAEGERPGAEHAPIVDWIRTARRLRTTLIVLAAVVLVTWLVLGAMNGGLAPRRLAELVGLGLLAAFVAEVVIVGGSAIRGLLRAGDRGERLASDDVAILPPQLRRRQR